MRARLAFSALALLAACAADDSGRRLPPQLEGLPMSAISVETASGRHRFQVWIAADPVSRERGLMGVRELPADHGMLFLFEQAYRATFWMKDTPLSLDLAFIAADGRVVNVERAATPMSLAPIVAAAPVAAVLELAAGTAARIGLQPGSIVRHAAFGTD